MMCVGVGLSILTNVSLSGRMLIMGEAMHGKAGFLRHLCVLLSVLL